MTHILLWRKIGFCNKECSAFKAFYTVALNIYQKNYLYKEIFSLQ